MTSNRAIFFLSTGRSGTQWLAKHLSAISSGIAVVEHEPLHDRYRSRELLQAADLADASNAELIGQHIAHIEGALETHMYIETGYPSWGAVRLLADHFAGRVAIVHLTRHPIPTACSLVSHRAYMPALLPGLHPERIPVTPFDRGALFPEFRPIWDDLDPFQRSLYFWAEVHGLGLRLEGEARSPWFRLRFEDLSSPTRLDELLEFLELAPAPEFHDAAHRSEDQFPNLCDTWWDVASAQQLPRLEDIAASLGYGLAEFDEEALRRRYLGV